MSGNIVHSLTGQDYISEDYNKEDILKIINSIELESDGDDIKYYLITNNFKEIRTGYYWLLVHWEVIFKNRLTNLGKEIVEKISENESLEYLHSKFIIRNIIK